MKNGKTAAGTQRWRCRSCGSSQSRKRPDVTRREQLRRFVSWLIGKQSQAEIDHTGTGRSFRRLTAWCWDVQPQLPPTETVYHAVMVDGLWVGTWCLLIALSDTGSVLAWQWCGGESTAAWTALLEQIPAPAVLVSDGGSGLPSALRRTWPETKHQRCLFHLQMNTTRHLTRKPRTTAGRALRRLVMALSTIDQNDETEAINWQLQLDHWWQNFGHLTEERTLFRDGKWGYKHAPLRKAWHLIRNVLRKGTLFTYIQYGNPRTTSALEGGINSQIRAVLRTHRGMTQAHMKRAAEWFLTLHELTLDNALKHASYPTKNKPPEQANEEHHPDETPSLYDTGLTAEEGLWTRTGWAGRT
ncbi:IS1249 family transposase [Paramicrobacterium sp. CJ85]|uniref:IS1249 family transposase n=1 Tax=Paramicrobacterium sp. CJ85 TaxID=3445355 RepID=UPI003F61587D